METVTLASGKTITMLTGWRSFVVTILFVGTIGTIAIVAWEAGKHLGRTYRSVLP